MTKNTPIKIRTFPSPALGNRKYQAITRGIFLCSIALYPLPPAKSKTLRTRGHHSLALSLISQSKAEQEDSITEAGSLQPEFPLTKVKRIIELDQEIDKINSDALHLITCSTQLFLHFLADRSAETAISKKRRTIKVEHLRAVAKNHQPTKDFLLDSLPLPPPPPLPPDGDGADHRRIRAVEKQVPEGTRRIEDFFRRPVALGETEDPNE